MEFTFTPLRVGLLLACLGVFAAFGGFTSPAAHLGFEEYQSIRSRPWIHCVAMFVTGAVAATIVDHWVGIMPPSSLRPIYVIGGVLLMVVSTTWYRSLLGTWARELAEISF